MLFQHVSSLLHGPRYGAPQPSALSPQPTAKRVRANENSWQGQAMNHVHGDMTCKMTDCMTAQGSQSHVQDDPHHMTPQQMIRSPLTAALFGAMRGNVGGTRQAVKQVRPQALKPLCLGDP